MVIDIHKNFRSLFLRTGIGANHIAEFKKYALNRWLLVKFKLNLYHQIIPVYQRYIDSLKDFDLKYDNKGLDIYFPDQLVQKINEQWNGTLSNKYKLIVGMAPGASFLTKQWHVEGFIEIAKYLIEKYQAAILLFGNGQDKAITTEIYSKIQEHLFDVAGQLSLLETTALMNYCHLVVTNDTGLMHIASALKKKVVAIFGSTTEELGFFPYTTDSRIVQNNDLKCRPCSHIGRNKLWYLFL